MGIVIALDSMPLNSDIHWPADYDARFIGEALLRTLSVEAADGSLEPGSALAVERLDGGRRWRVTLDSSATWSDGTPLTSEHALASVRAVLARPRSAPARLLYAEGPADPVVRLGRHVLEYRFAKPVSYVPALLTLPQFAPSRDTHGQGPVLGWYEMSERSSGMISLRLRNTAFGSGRSEDRPPVLEFRKFRSAGEALDALSRGEADISPTTSFSARDVAEYEGRGNFQSRGIAIFGSLEFGARSGRLSGSPDLRRILGCALDRELIAERCPGLVTPFLRQTAPWPAPLSPPRPLPEPLTPTAVEIDSLRRELGDPIEIAYADFTPNGTIVQAVCDQLHDTFGITATPRPLDYAGYVRAAVRRDHSLLYTLTTAEFPHPAALLAPWRTDGAAARRTGFADAVLDGLLDAASEESDVAAQSALWAAADTRWAELMPRVPLLQVRAHCVHSDRLTGARLNSSGLIDFGRLALVPEVPETRTRAQHAEEARA